ncbi:ribbon-helix-helix domain-containing protein [bacterium]|nr:ribbon-helix-helix domain-containing protein [bacterium]MCK4326011.1 ribbon-helix-helix domain-containing protein [bacterium]
MPIIQYSTKLASEQVKALRKISTETHIPQAVLVRQAVSMLIEELDGKAISLNFLNLMKKKVKDEKELLKKLSSS